MLPEEDRIDVAANFQAGELENSAKGEKNEISLPITFRRRSSSHTLKLSLSGNISQDDNGCATYNDKLHIPKLLKNRDSINISSCKKIPSKAHRSSAIDYSAAESIGSRLLNICEGKEEGICFNQEINSLHARGCLYDVLLLQDEKNQDTPLHVAIKKNRVDFVKEFLCILKEPYCANKFYKHKYFERKQENEKPLSKVINTKNKDGKDIITLTIEGNNPKCIPAFFKHLTYENINRERDVESGYTPLHEAVLLGKNEAIKELLKSRYVNTELIDRGSYKARNHANDEEAIELFIQHYSGKINDLRKKLVGSKEKLAQMKCVLRKTKFTCMLLAAFGSCFGIYKNSHGIVNEEVSENTLYYFLELLFSTIGLILFFNYSIDIILSKYKKENSSLKKELNNYKEGREKLESELRCLQKNDTRVTTQMSEIISVTRGAELSYSR